MSRELKTTTKQQATVISEIIENYTLLTNPELTGKYFDRYQESLKQDMIDYADDREVEYTIETLCKVAYFRLKKVSDQYHIAKSYGSNEENLQKIQAKAKMIKKEYDIVSALSEVGLV